MSDDNEKDERLTDDLVDIEEGDDNLPDWAETFVEEVCEHTQSLHGYGWMYRWDGKPGAKDSGLEIELFQVPVDHDGQRFVGDNFVIDASAIAAMLDPDPFGQPRIEMDDEGLSISGSYRDQPIGLNFLHKTPEDAPLCDGHGLGHPPFGYRWADEADSADDNDADGS